MSAQRDAANMKAGRRAFASGLTPSQAKREANARGPHAGPIFLHAYTHARRIASRPKEP